MPLQSEKAPNMLSDTLHPQVTTPNVAAPTAATERQSPAEESAAQPTEAIGEIAYMLKRYPRLSETFILHEMLALEALGLRLRVYSQLDPAEDVIHPDIQRLKAPVTYLPQITPGGLAQMLGAHLRLFRRSPRRYLRTFSRVVARKDAFASLKHFIRGGWLGRELEVAGVTHLHAHFAHGPAATAQYVHQLYGIPFSFTGHAKDIFTTPQEHIAERLREASFAVTCTRFNQRYLASLVDPATADRIQCLYHGVDQTRFHPYPTLPPTTPPPAEGATPIILAVGRLVEKKGFPYLIQACALLKSRGVAFHCIIVGTGPMRNIVRTLIAQAGLGDAVELHPACTQEALVELYRQATVVTLPSIQLDNGDRDGIPNVLVEAMAMGLPVVSTTISGIGELVEHQHNGMLVRSRYAEALAEALATVLGDAPLRQRLGQAAQATIARHFDLMANTQWLVNRFSQALAEAHVPTSTATIALSGERYR